MKHIVYPNPDSGVSIVIVTDAVPLEENCRQSVPPGVPYRLVDEEDLPKTREERAAYTLDFSTPDGHGADYGVGTPWKVAAYQDGVAAVAFHEQTREVRELNAHLRQAAEE